MKSLTTTLASLFTLVLFGQAPRIVYPVVNNRNPERILFSADNRYVLTGKEDHISLWSRNPARLLNSYAADFGAADFSPDSKSIVYLSNGAVILTNLKTGNKQTILPGGTVTGRVIRFSHDGKFIMVNNMSQDTIRLWSCPGGQLLQSIRGNIYKMVLTKDSRTLIAMDGTTCIKRDLPNQKQLQSFTIEKGYDARISPDGNTLASFNKNDLVTWDINSGLQLRKLTGHSGYIASVSFSDNGKKMMSYASDSPAIVWDTRSGSVLGKFPCIADLMFPNPWLLSPDGEKVCVGYKKNILLYNLADGKLYDSFNTHQGSRSYYQNVVSFSADSKYCGIGTPTALLFYSIAGKQTTVIRGFGKKIIQALICPGNKYLLSCNETTATLVAISTGTPLVEMEMGRENYECAFNGDGTRLLMWDGRDLDIWSIPDGKLVSSIRNNRYGRIIKPFINAAGDKIGIVANNDISIWETNTGKELRRIRSNNSLVDESPVFSHDGTLLLTANRDSVMVYRVDSGTLVKRFSRDKTDSIYSFVITGPGDKYLMASNARHDFSSVWNMSTGEKLFSVMGSDPQFTLDGEHIIAGKKVYAIATGKEATGYKGSFPLMNPAPQYQASIPNDESMQNRIVELKENMTGIGYYIIPMEGDDWLVFDSYGRFDGTPKARAILSLACGDKINDDEKSINKLWVPGLAGRIMKGEEIKAPKISEMECNR